MQNLIALGKALHILPVSRTDCLPLLAGSLLLIIGSTLRSLRRQLALRLDFCLRRIHNLGNERVVHIHGDVVGVWHLTIEIHASAQAAHLAVPSHELALGDEHRVRTLAESVPVHEVVVALGKHCLEHVLKVIPLVLLHLQPGPVLLRDEVVNAV